MSIKPPRDLGDLLGVQLRKPKNAIVDLFNGPGRHRDKGPAETAEAMITGMVRLAYAGFPKAKVDKELGLVLGDFWDGGPIPRMLQHLIVGKVIPRPRGAAAPGAAERAKRWRRFALCVLVQRLSLEERETAWLGVGDRRQAGKRKAPSDDLFILAACLDDRSLVREKAKAAGSNFRRAFDRCVSTGEFCLEDVPQVSKWPPGGLPPPPPLKRIRTK